MAGASFNRKVKKNRIRAVWNSAFMRLDYYLQGTRGKYILCNPYAGKFINQGPGYALKQLVRMGKQ
jgi:hypothetical protein